VGGRGEIAPYLAIASQSFARSGRCRTLPKLGSDDLEPEALRDRDRGRGVVFQLGWLGRLARRNASLLEHALKASGRDDYERAGALGLRLAGNAHRFLVVLEPTWKSADAARRIVDFLSSSGRQPALFVANKVTEAGLGPVERVPGVPLFATIASDEAVLDAHAADVAPIDDAPSCPAVAAIEQLVDDLDCL